MKRITMILALLMVQSGFTSAARAAVNQGLPNLIIDSISSGTSWPQAGEECKVAVTVKNIGNETARNFEVCLWKNHDGEPANATGADATVSVSSLASGEKKTLEFKVVWPGGGTFSVWALADAGNGVNEIDETDNTRSCLVQVAGPSTSSLVENSTPTPTPAEQVSSSGNCFVLGFSLPFLLSLAGLLIMTRPE